MATFLEQFFFAQFYLQFHIISSMNNSKGTNKSARSYGAQAEPKKNQLHIASSSRSIVFHSEIHPAVNDLQEIQLPKTPKEKKTILVKSAASREGKESSLNIRSRSCLKKEHSNLDEDEDLKSSKSIKFKNNLDNVFVYSLPQNYTKSGKETAKRSARRRQKVDEECCYIY